MPSHTFEQFVRFTTDAAGLERTFRLFQSIAQILASYILPFNILLFLLSFLPSSTTTTNGKAFPDAATTHAVLLGLRANFNLARRYFRLFRFLESFAAAQKIYTSIQHSSHIRTSTPENKSRFGATAPLWIDVFGRTFNGMYLLLEASALLDVQRIPGLSIWGPELEPLVAVEGQQFWLFSLVCGVVAGLMRLADLVLPLPSASRDDGGVSAGEKMQGSDADAGKEEGKEKGEEGDGREEEEEEKDEKMDEKVKTDQLVKRQEVRAKISNLTRRIVSDALDITLPGSVVGWVPASTGTVGLAMFVTTILTSMDIWERCGREVASTNK
ncbi:peroxisomal biogenesis factor 11-domain-containing protein [Xylaria arbuscula]|nr:peroxisomal biogenesis factor 11-domain-containing protein [Xylaria arbuscula]